MDRNFKRKSVQEKNEIDEEFIGDLQKENKQKMSKKEIEYHKLNVEEIEERYSSIVNNSKTGFNIANQNQISLCIYYKLNNSKSWEMKKVDYSINKTIRCLKREFVEDLRNSEKGQNIKQSCYYKFQGPLLDDNSSIASGDLMDEDEQKTVDLVSPPKLLKKTVFKGKYKP